MGGSGFSFPSFRCQNQKSRPEGRPEIKLSTGALLGAGMALAAIYRIFVGFPGPL